jgi:hypothetical protein
VVSFSSSATRRERPRSVSVTTEYGYVAQSTVRDNSTGGRLTRTSNYVSNMFT